MTPLSSSLNTVFVVVPDSDSTEAWCVCRRPLNLCPCLRVSRAIVHNPPAKCRNPRLFDATILRHTNTSRQRKTGIPSRMPSRTTQSGLFSVRPGAAIRPATSPSPVNPPLSLPSRPRGRRRKLRMSTSCDAARSTCTSPFHHGAVLVASSSPLVAVALVEYPTK